MRGRARLAAALLALGAGAAAAQDAAPLVVDHLPASLAGEWLFRLGHDPTFSSPFREQRNWQHIRVPGSWQQQGWPEHTGHVWYRLPLVISSDLAGHDLGLDLGQVGDVDEMFLNGRRIGSTGSFPPHADNAQLARRFYLIPREVLRPGQLNELSVHVYSESRTSGLLGPTPTLDLYQTLLSREVMRDIVIYAVATLLLTLTCLHVLLFARQRDLHEHLAFASAMSLLALFFTTRATWGLHLLLGYGFTHRLTIAAMMAGIAVFPAVPFRLARRNQPAVLLGAETLLALGAAFALVWRKDADIEIWLYVSEAAALMVAAVTLRIVASLLGRRPWAPALFASSVLFAGGIATDVLVDIGVLHRVNILGGDMVTLLACVPFVVSMSAALSLTWIERRWGEPLDAATALMSRERFTDRLGAELLRARRSGSPLAVALLRLTVAEAAGEREQPAAEAVANLRRALRQIDLLARYDGETFALLLAETDERAAMSIIERLRRTAAQGVSLQPGRARTTGGLAQYRPGRHLSAEELLREAEAALYAAVSEGGDCTATAP